MKTNPSLLRVLHHLGASAAFVLCTALMGAETLATDTAVFIQTDPQAPVIARLKAGTTVNVIGEAPAGWKRIEVGGTFEAYVQRRDISKSLEVNEGANVYTTPSKTAPVLTVAQHGDKSDVIGLAQGDFVQIKLEKKIQGFIAVGDTANTPAESKAAPLAATPALPVMPVSTVGRPVTLTGDTAAMPRLFAGKLVLAKRALLNPNPLYDYQVTDSSGRRFAYVDTKRLLLNDKIEVFLDRDITITGTVRNTVDGKDLVIVAEAMQLK
ncbi:MAG: SH3 domain-containing protein [Opitutae bacterium]